MRLLNKKYLVTDAIHKLIRFDSNEGKYVKRVIDHQTFQRLRHIKQLGLTELVFPTANHTRFSHSIGAAWISKNILNNSSKADIKLKEDESIATILAGLIHDIGHGPFSHAFESLFDKKTKYSHEKWTPLFVKRICRDSKSGSLKDVLGQSLQILSEEQKHPLGAIVSSQLDCDRLDYLLRDSHFCGVNFGSYNLNWLLESLCLIKNGKVLRLGVSRKGISSVEEVLLARRLMTHNVYYHGIVKSAEFLLIRFLRELWNDLRNSIGKKIQVNNAIREFLLKSDIYSKDVFSPKIYQDLFSSYAQLTDMDVWQAINEMAANHSNRNAGKIARRFYSRQLPRSIKVKPGSVDPCLDCIEEYKKKQKNIADWQIHLDAHPFSLYKESKTPIFVINQDRLVEVTNESTVLDRVKAIEDGKSFLYIDREIALRTSVIKLLDHLFKEKQYIDDSYKSWGD